MYLFITITEYNLQDQKRRLKSSLDGLTQEFDVNGFFFNDDAETQRDYDDGNHKSGQEACSEREVQDFRQKEAGSTTLAIGEFLSGTGFKLEVPSTPLRRHTSSSLVDFHHGSYPHLCLTSRDVTRWKMAWRFVQTISQDIKNPTDTDLYDYVQSQNLLARRCKDWPDAEKIFGEFRVAMGFSA